ncbi:MAG: hypothetical protein MUC92_01730 [Fimbriimonadaceae bacterium]|jgi:hypothetical protein|nr:hypothetical protein [Fimbriimonadaceae bacterium]
MISTAQMILVFALFGPTRENHKLRWPYDLKQPYISFRETRIGPEKPGLERIASLEYRNEEQFRQLKNLALKDQASLEDKMSFVIVYHSSMAKRRGFTLEEEELVTTVYQRIMKGTIPLNYLKFLTNRILLNHISFDQTSVRLAREMLRYGKHDPEALRFFRVSLLYEGSFDATNELISFGSQLRKELPRDRVGFSFLYHGYSKRYFYTHTRKDLEAADEYLSTLLKYELPKDVREEFLFMQQVLRNRMKDHDKGIIAGRKSKRLRGSSAQDQ